MYLPVLFRARRWSLPVADYSMFEPQTWKTVGERRLGNPKVFPQTGEEARCRPVWRSLDGWDGVVSLLNTVDDQMINPEIDPLIVILFVRFKPPTTSTPRWRWRPWSQAACQWKRSWWRPTWWRACSTTNWFDSTLWSPRRSPFTSLLSIWKRVSLDLRRFVDSESYEPLFLSGWTTLQGPKSWKLQVLRVV